MLCILKPFIVNVLKLTQFSKVLFIEVILALLFEINLAEIKAVTSLNILSKLISEYN